MGLFTMRSTLGSTSFYVWAIIASALMIAICNYGVRLSYSVFLKPMIQDFGWTRAMAAGAYSVCTITLGVFSIVFGRLTDRYGATVVLTICGVFSGAGIILLGTVDNLCELYLFFGVIVGIGAAAYVPLTTGISRWFDEKKGLILGIVVSGMALGPAILAPIATHLISNYGWRQTFLMLGVITGIAVVLGAQIIRVNLHGIGSVPHKDNSTIDIQGIGATNESNTEPISRQVDWTFKLAIKERMFWLIAVSYGLWCVSIISIPVHAVPIITDKGIAPADAAKILSMLLISSMVGRLVMGALSDKIGRIRSIYICLGINMVTLVWIIFANNIWMFSLFAVVYGFSYGGSVPQWAALVGDIFGLVAMGTIFGAMVFIITLVGTIGPIFFGHIFDVTGSYNIAFLISVLLMGIALITLSFIKPKICM